MPSQNNWDNTKTFGNETLDASEMNQIADNIEALSAPPYKSVSGMTYSYDNNNNAVYNYNIGTAKTITLQDTGLVAVLVTANFKNSDRHQLRVSVNGGADVPMTDLAEVPNPAYTEKFILTGVYTVWLGVGTHTFQFKTKTRQINVSFDVEIEINRAFFWKLGV